MRDGEWDTIRVRIPSRIDFAGGWSDVPAFAAQEGGVVLNAAIDRYVEGSASWEGGEFRLQYRLPAPPGSHLGTSAAIDVAWLALSLGLMHRRPGPRGLAETAYRLEKLLGAGGGKQDLYAATLGGFNLLRFGAEDRPAMVEHLELPPATLGALERCSLLCYSGSPPPACSIHDEVWDRYRRGERAVACALRAIRDSAVPARTALLAGDFAALAAQLVANREASRCLHPGVVTGRMDALFAAGERAGAIGSKPCGGGGGCLFFLCAEGRRPAVEAALTTQGAEILPFAFALEPPLPPAPAGQPGPWL